MKLCIRKERYMNNIQDSLLRMSVLIPSISLAFISSLSLTHHNLHKRIKRYVSLINNINSEIANFGGVTF
jgi:hypothetical protein